MNITEIAFTGTPVTDISRARAFYEGVLGLSPSLESAGGLWVEYEIGNGTFGIGCYGDAWLPSPQGTCIAFEVDDLDGFVVLELPVRHVALPGLVGQVGFETDPGVARSLLGLSSDEAAAHEHAMDRRQGRRRRSGLS